MTTAPVCDYPAIIATIGQHMGAREAARERLVALDDAPGVPDILEHLGLPLAPDVAATWNGAVRHAGDVGAAVTLRRLASGIGDAAACRLRGSPSPHLRARDRVVAEIMAGIAGDCAAVLGVPDYLARLAADMEGAGPGA